MKNLQNFTIPQFQHWKRAGNSDKGKKQRAKIQVGFSKRAEKMGGNLACLTPDNLTRQGESNDT